MASVAIMADDRMKSQGISSPLDREIGALALPALGALAAEPLYVLVDTAIVGPLGTTQLASLQVGVLTAMLQTLSLRAGAHTLDWVPDVTLRPRTYLLRLRVEDAICVQAAQRSVVRLLGVDAGFLKLGAAPGENAVLGVRTDAQQFTVQILHCGP